MPQLMVRLPMYRSCFRDNGPLGSTIDVCNKSSAVVFADGQQCTLSRPTCSPFQGTSLENLLSGELSAIVCELYGMTYILDLHMRKPSKIGRIQREFFEDTYAAVQRSLVCFPYASAMNIMKSKMYYRQECWRIAAYIYLSTDIRNWDKATELL